MDNLAKKAKLSKLETSHGSFASITFKKANSELSELSKENSIRAQVFQELDKNQLLTAKPLCRILGIPFGKYESYINNLRSQWKANQKNRQALKCLNFHNWRGWVYLPSSVDRTTALECGWIQTRMRNKGFLFQDPKLGRLEWFETGRVNIWIRKPANPGKLKQLLANAFFKTHLISDITLLEALTKSVVFSGAHAVYETGLRLPHLRIDDFKESNGVVVKTGDESHPTAVEVEFHRNRQADDLREATLAFIDIIKELSSSCSPAPVKNIGVV